MDPVGSSRRPQSSRGGKGCGEASWDRRRRPRLRRRRRRLQLPHPYEVWSLLPLPWWRGNPVFFVTDARVLGLLHFFTRDACFQSLDLRAPALSQQRHAARGHRQRRHAVHAPQPRRGLRRQGAALDRVLERRGVRPPPPPRLVLLRGVHRVAAVLRQTRNPHWVDSYLDRLGHVLRQGGWRDTEVT
ncbi:unnamed protein product [Miscanthus lutarioriparius]|uniref:Uncharacterized protein n=1 Tax=Miscanthus lutarioriparius TaxID=422564 RepID=A0A811MCI5_9POAL|nr:unnamed protein product [Miscanthus lutarioriparius]